MTELPSRRRRLRRGRRRHLRRVHRRARTHPGPEAGRLDLREASSIPLAGGTALAGGRARRRRARAARARDRRVRRRRKPFAVQLAKGRGAHVTAVCGARNARAGAFPRRRRGHRLAARIRRHAIRTRFDAIWTSSATAARCASRHPRTRRRARALVRSGRTDARPAPAPPRRDRRLAFVQRQPAAPCRRTAPADPALAHRTRSRPAPWCRSSKAATPDRNRRGARRFGEQHARSKFVIQMEES